jgi:predicted nucleotidyltransferase component of viral defense system
MQQLTMLIEKSRAKGKLYATNIAREYLQVLVLKAIYQSPYGRELSFMGGTCLRLCYGLKRYSEDLDFSHDAPTKAYSFVRLNRFIEGRLNERGLSVGVAVKEPKTVDRSFIRFPLDSLGLAERKGQKLHIKLEIDNRPPAIRTDGREEYFLGRYNEVFPIIKHVERVLFAGKVLAILLRPQLLGRDCYDLIWYLQRKTPCDFSYLNAGLRSAGKTFPPIRGFSGLLLAVRGRLNEIQAPTILQDIQAFLEDPTEADWIKRYPEVFEQMSKNRPPEDKET